MSRVQLISVLLMTLVFVMMAADWWQRRMEVPELTPPVSAVDRMPVAPLYAPKLPKQQRQR